jgi:hypothetical protein
MSIKRPGVAVTICVPRFKSAICSATPAPPYTAVDLHLVNRAGQQEANGESSDSQDQPAATAAWLHRRHNSEVAREYGEREQSKMREKRAVVSKVQLLVITLLSTFETKNNGNIGAQLTLVRAAWHTACTPNEFAPPTPAPALESVPLGPIRGAPTAAEPQCDGAVAIHTPRFFRSQSWQSQ